MDAGTPAGAHNGTDDGEEYLPPCRHSVFLIVPCPQCGKQLRLKTLRYSHVCGRSFDPAQRAREQQAAAEKAINARMASMEQPAERSVQRTTERTQQDVDKKTSIRV